MHDSTPSRSDYPVSYPFSWGNQYMAEMPTVIEDFISILEIDLLQEFEDMMG